MRLHERISRSRESLADSPVGQLDSNSEYVYAKNAGSEATPGCDQECLHSGNEQTHDWIHRMIRAFAHLFIIHLKTAENGSRGRIMIADRPSPLSCSPSQSMYICRLCAASTSIAQSIVLIF